MQPRPLLFVFTLLANVWIWRMVSQTILIGIVTVACSAALFLAISNEKILVFKLGVRTTSREKDRNHGFQAGMDVITKKKLLHQCLFILLLFTLCAFQWQTTQRVALTSRDNDEQRVQQMRLKEYPPTYIQVGNKTLWIPLGFWLDGRNELLVITRIQQHVFENLDANQYFFATHPRERGYEEFEKFPYIFLPFWFIGSIALFSQKRKIMLALSIVLPLSLLAFIGNNNTLGPFALFPFFAVTITEGLSQTYERLKRLSQTQRVAAFMGFGVLFAVVFYQVTRYAFS